MVVIMWSASSFQKFNIWETLSINVVNTVSSPPRPAVVLHCRLGTRSACRVQLMFVTWAFCNHATKTTMFSQCQPGSFSAQTLPKCDRMTNIRFACCCNSHAVLGAVTFFVTGNQTVPSFGYENVLSVHSNLIYFPPHEVQSSLVTNTCESYHKGFIKTCVDVCSQCDSPLLISC